MSRGEATFRLRFWGVTGSYASPLSPRAVLDKVLDCVEQLGQLPDFCSRVSALCKDRAALEEFVTRHMPLPVHSTYGGNTTCIEVQTGDSLLIVDSGSGFRRLGEEITRRWQDASESDREAHVLLTHAHLDHTFTTPFVEPYYDARNAFHLWGPRKVIKSLHAVLSPRSRLRSTYFPPTYESLEGIKQFKSIRPGATFMIGKTQIRTHKLVHPGGSLAYRFDRDGRSFVVATDHEHHLGPDEALAEFARAADVLYIDAQYLQREYDGRVSVGDELPTPRKGWGHSTVEAVIPTAVAARARQVLLGHHDPKRSDRGLAELEKYAQQLLRDELRGQGRPAESCQVRIAYEDLVVEA